MEINKSLATRREQRESDQERIPRSGTTCTWEPSTVNFYQAAYCVPGTVLGTLTSPHPSVMSLEVMVKAKAQMSSQRKGKSEREELCGEPRTQLEMKVTVKGN